MENGTIIIPPYAYKILGLKHAELLVYGVIYGFTIGSKGRFFGSLKTLSEMTGLNRCYIREVLQKLTNKGYLKKYTISVMRVEYECTPKDEIVTPEKQETPKKRKITAKKSQGNTNPLPEKENQSDGKIDGLQDDFQLESESVSQPENEKPQKTANLPQNRQPESEVLTPIAIVWQAYKQAYYERYAAYPLQNAKVMGQIKQFVAQVGQDNAAAIAVFFVSHNNSWYVQKKHDIGTLLMNAQAVAVDWQKGTQTTRQAAQWEEQHATAMGAAEEAKRIIRQMHEQRQQKTV